MSSLECAGCCKPCGHDYVSCSTCKGLFHYTCAGVAESSYRKWSKVKKENWKCSVACRKSCDWVAEDFSCVTTGKEPQSALKAIINESPVLPQQIRMLNPDNDLLIALKSPKMSTTEKLDSLTALVSSLFDSVQFQSNKLDDVLKTIQLQNEKIASQNRQLLEKNEQIKKLHAENKKLSNTVQILEQNDRKKKVEIHGIQEREGENLRNVVKEMSSLLHIKCEDSDVDLVHRMPSAAAARNGKKRRPILVQFHSQRIRDEWLRKRRTGLVSNNLVKGSGDDPLFINVNLSPRSKELFWKARIVKNQLGYNFCYVGDSGDIFLKKTRDSNRITIRSEEDLPSVPSTPPPPQVISVCANKK